MTVVMMLMMIIIITGVFIVKLDDRKNDVFLL